MGTVQNIARNAVRPGYFPEMARKVGMRVRYGRRETLAATRWAAEQATDLDAWAQHVDAALWAETLDYSRGLRAAVQPQLNELEQRGIDLGGGGCFELLYFLARLRRPSVVLETGVAAGWSSRAILSALDQNGHGRLLSSDFPYFRMANPERYVGILVPDELGSRWTLRLKGDRKNLPELLEPGTLLDLVHYDSDKSRGGREYFIQAIRPHLGHDTVIVMDDIDDDLFFHDWVWDTPSVVFYYMGKYVGLVGA